MVSFSFSFPGSLSNLLPKLRNGFVVSLILLAGCENGKLVENVGYQNPEANRSDAIQIRRTLPEQLDSAVLKKIAREVEAKGISHPQLEAMLLELDSIRRGRARGSTSGLSLDEKLARCGIDHPELVSDLTSGVTLKPASIGDRALRAQVRSWVSGSVQPLAKQILGQPVVTVNSAGIYACRTINREPARELSRHAFGLALDVSGFVLADGSRIPVRGGFSRRDEAGAFLNAVADQACRYFSTTLSPKTDSAHSGHFHLDLKFKADGSLRRQC